ncbi:MAG: hypothetical protein AABY26_05895 [Nanoarchaeota archaeon]
MEIKYATKWVEGEYGPDIAAYHGRRLGIEILNTILQELDSIDGHNYKSPVDLASFRYMEVLPYSHLLVGGRIRKVELLLESETNDFIDYTVGDCLVHQYRSAIKIEGEEKTLEQLAGVLEKYKAKKTK